MAELREQLSSTAGVDHEILRMSLKTLNATLQCGINVELMNGNTIHHTGKKAAAVRRRVQPLTWACKDLAKLFEDMGDLKHLGVSKVTLSNVIKCRVEQPDAPNHMLKAAEEARAIFQQIGDVAGQADALQYVVRWIQMEGSVVVFIARACVCVCS